MKLLKHYLLSSIVITACPILNAEPQTEPSHLTQSLKIGFEGGYYTYQEPNLVNNKGGLFGAFGEYKLHFDNAAAFLPDTVMLESNIKGGDTDYSSNGTGKLNSIGHFLGEGRVLLGKTFQAPNDIKLIPFIGFGYRYLNTEKPNSKTTTGNTLYERESNYLYLPVGLKLNAKLNQDWDLDVGAEYDIFISGEQKSYLSNVRTYYPDIVNQQHNGYGVRAAIDLTKKTESVGFLIGTYVRWWDIGTSMRNLNWYEPENQSLEIGLRAGLTF